MSRGPKVPARRDPLAAGAGGSRAVVAIVGRPNVGKSTLFNRLAGRKLAIVEDVAGVTRDRHYADANALGKEYVLIDTGGFDPESDDPMASSIAGQVELAVEECDAVVCVLDATADPTPADREAVRLLRNADKPTLFVANKADSRKQQHTALGLYELGIDELLPVSALHGHGTGDLEEAIAALLPDRADLEPLQGRDCPRVAIIGRPNAGKSSLVNRLVGEERHLVDDRPGTTVDPIDSLLHRDGNELLLIDTAGIRRKRSVKKEGVEGLAVLHAIRSMERAHAVVLMIDAAAGPAEQDAKIAGLAVERGRALVIALNKMDLVGPDQRKEVIERTKEILAFASSWTPVIPLSVKSGRAVNKLMASLDAAIAEHDKRVPTGEVNRFFEEVLERHPPPTMKKKPVRLFYVTQAEVRPPTFVVMTNEPDRVHFSYKRYVENQLRERFGFEGTPLRVRYRKRRRRGDDAEP